MATTKINHPDLLDLDSSTGATVFPKGTTAERPVSPEAGYIRFNTTEVVMETYDGTEWLTLDTIASTYSVDYLVVAGGGGAANGGGGAGGLRTSFGTTSGGGGSAESSLTFTAASTYNIVVGAGGVLAVSGTNSGQTDGDNSSLSGDGITTITSIGGGATASGNGLSIKNGGSGGGGLNGTGTIATGGLGTSGQGFNGGNGCCNYPSDSYGGGGGASAAGTNGTGATTTGDGGAGLAVNILNSSSASLIPVGEVVGSDVYYAGGGGAYGRNDPQGVGGIGGGGDGGYAGDRNGLPNSGGGAGSYLSGGSGVVILRMPTANYSGTTTGSPTVTTDGSDTILIYTSSGTYTA